MQHATCLPMHTCSALTRRRRRPPRSGTRIRLVAATSSTREVHRKAHHLEADHSRTFMSSETAKVFSVSKSTT